MIYRKDKRGLLVKSGSDEEDSDSKESDNPVFKALNSIKIRHQISTESSESQLNSKGSSFKSTTVQILSSICIIPYVPYLYCIYNVCTFLSI